MSKIFNPKIIKKEKQISTTRKFIYHKVLFDVNGGYLTSGELDQRVEHGKAATPPSVDHSGYWYFDYWEGDFKNVTNDRVIKAHYYYNKPKPTYTVTWDANGGKWSDGDPTKTYYVTEGNDSPNPGQPNPPAGAVFNRWIGGSPYDVHSDQTIKAYWSSKA